MTPAEFDTRRRLLGLSIEETADWCGANRITIQRWIKGQARIAPAAIARLEELENAMSNAVEASLATAADHSADTVRLTRYRDQAALDASPHASGTPLGAHAILIGWIADALEAEGHDVKIMWSEHP